MRFLVDECTGPAVARWLREQGHEVFSVPDEAHGLDDETLLRKASQEGWILITNDKGFGERVYRQRSSHRGVVFLRLEDERTSNKIAVLSHLLQRFQDQLEGRFVVATELHVRFSDI